VSRGISSRRRWLGLAQIAVETADSGVLTAMSLQYSARMALRHAASFDGSAAVTFRRNGKFLLRESPLSCMSAVRAATLSDGGFRI